MPAKITTRYIARFTYTENGRAKVGELVIGENGYLATTPIRTADSEFSTSHKIPASLEGAAREFRPTVDLARVAVQRTTHPVVHLAIGRLTACKRPTFGTVWTFDHADLVTCDDCARSVKAVA